MVVDQANWKSDANVYGFLARLWIAELDQSVIDQLTSGELRDAYLELGGVSPSSDNTGDAIEELAIAFCGCFLGPKGHLPPHQSVVSHSRFQGDCLSSLKQFVDIIGQPNGELFQQQKMLDHAGVELALMQRVCAYGSQCDADESQAVSELRIQFFESHLQWLNDYCEVASNKTNSDFYRGLFAVTGKFLLAERTQNTSEAS